MVLGQKWRKQTPSKKLNGVHFLKDFQKMHNNRAMSMLSFDLNHDPSATETQHYYAFFENLLESEPPFIFNFRGGLLSSLH